MPFFMCSKRGFQLVLKFSKNLGRDFLEEEGFIMQKLEGDGMAFVHAGGTTLAKNVNLARENP